MSFGWLFLVGWDVFPLHGSASYCKDVRFPRIINGQIYGCGSAGIVDRSWSINGGPVERTDPPVFQPEHSSMMAGPVEQELLGKLVPSSKPIPWHWAAMTSTHLWWLETDRVCRWSAGGTAECQPAHEPLFLVTSSGSVAWSEPDQIVWLKEGTEARLIRAQSIRGLSVSERRLCWSAWHDDENGVDIFCSDGFHLLRSGDQLWPMETEERLFFREGLTVFEVR